MNLFQTIFVPLCALIATLTLARTVRGHLAWRTGLAWSAVWLAVALTIGVPSSATTAAAWLGIGRGADLVFYLAILAGLAAALYFYTRYRRLEVMLTELIRREGLRTARKGGGSPQPAGVLPPDSTRPAGEVGQRDTLAH